MFLDTSGLFCIHHIDEPRSDEAQTLFEVAGRKLGESKGTRIVSTAKLSLPGRRR